MIERLREELSSLAPYPAGCVGFEDRPQMNGTAFFPGGNGTYRPNESRVRLSRHSGVLVLGSDFGDVESYDEQFKFANELRHEEDGRTWQGLLKLIDASGIDRNSLFCTNAWPCLRAGRERVKGGIPGKRNAEFTNRCLNFFQMTLSIIKPKLVLTLGVAPTAFVATNKPDLFGLWHRARAWADIDREPVKVVQGVAFVPVVHPSMPNRRHRAVAKTFEGEAELIRMALRMVDTRK